MLAATTRQWSRHEAPTDRACKFAAAPRCVVEANSSYVLVSVHARRWRKDNGINNGVKKCANANVLTRCWSSLTIFYYMTWAAV